MVLNPSYLTNYYISVNASSTYGYIKYVEFKAVAKDGSVLKDWSNSTLHNDFWNSSVINNLIGGNTLFYAKATDNLFETEILQWNKTKN